MFPNHDSQFRTGYMIGDKACCTPVGKLSYPFLFRPQMPGPDNDLKEPKYSAALLLAGPGSPGMPEGADLTAMSTVLSHALAHGKNKYGLDREQWPVGFKTAFREQSEKKMQGYAQTPGHKFFTAGGKSRPSVIDINGNPITDESLIYPGCYVRFIVNSFDYKAKGNCGVSFGLEHVQFIAHGEPLGNRIPVEGAFKPVTPVNPTGAAAPAAGNTAANLFA